MNDPAGILLLDKPAGPTSHDAVNVVRRALGTRRVGHFGTLDPFATGLLVCAVGPATRLGPFVQGHDKGYRAVVRLGWRSTTGDPEGDLAPTGSEPAPRSAVEAACGAWTGEVEQIPPAYSAKHVAGERAYRRARAGEAITLEAVVVRIDRLEIMEYVWPDLTVEIDCGPGTYVRALARDIGEDLGTGGYCARLRRTRSGPFAAADTLSWEELRDARRARAALLPSWSAVADLPAVELDAQAARAVVHGQAVLSPPDLADGPGWIRLHGPRGFIGLAEREPASDRLRPRKVLFPEGEGR